jgi:hypothetical protein
VKRVEEEINRWQKEKWAINPAHKTIFQILDKEILNDVLMIYGKNYSNASHHLNTLLEASSLEKIKGILNNHFFQSPENLKFEENKDMMKEIKVEDGYRTNPLSHQPGGDEIKVYLRDGMIYTYDKIKSPANYINKLEFKENIVRIDINGQKTWSSIDPGDKYWEI